MHTDESTVAEAQRTGAEAQSLNAKDRATPTAALRWVYSALGLFCFNRISVARHAAVPLDGPVLFLGLHRNGAIDGIPYLKAVPGAAYLVSAQLHRSALGRWLFPGIAVARRKDRARGIDADNGGATARCVSRLVAGRPVFVLPEGTSSLGPRHLPFQRGAAAIIARTLRDGTPLTVVPLAVHYECAWEWQSRVEVVVGEPVVVSPADAPLLESLHSRVVEALERTGINVASPEELALVERLAFAATLGSRTPYGGLLKRFERSVSLNLRSCDAQLARAARSAGARTFQGIALIPLGSVVPSLLAWIALALPMLAFLLVNAPVVLAGWTASRKLADDRNVIAFWRTVVAAPAAILWSAALTGGLVALGHAGSAGLYLALTAFGIRALRAFRKLSVAVYNGLFAKAVRAPFRMLSTELRQSLGLRYG